MKVVAALSLLLVASVAGLSQVQQGFDFRNTQNAAPDPPGSTYVLASTAYPTTVGGMTFGWANTYLVQGRDRNGNNNNLDPRLAGVNLITNGSPATFYVDLPAPGTYSLSLAMGDAGYEECWSQCQIQFLGRQHGSGHRDPRRHQARLLLRCGRQQLVSHGLAGKKRQPAGNADRHALDGDRGDQQSHRRLHSNRLPGNIGRNRYRIPVSAIAGSGTGTTGFYGADFHPSQRLQQPYRLVGGNGAGGRDDHVEPGHHTRPRVGLVNHDGNSGAGRDPGNVSDRRDRHWRRHEWSHHRSSDCEAVNQPQAEGRISLAAIKRKA